MKRKNVVRNGLVLMVVVSLMFGTGCTQAIFGAQPVPPSVKLSRAEIFAAFDRLALSPEPGIKIPIGLEQEWYNSVPMGAVENATAALVLDPDWGPITAAEALIVEIRRADSRAAAGLILLGNTFKADYRVVACERTVDGGIVIALIDVLARNVAIWDLCGPVAFIAM